MTTMRSISVLPADLANKIAAGEVIERPASVVKELVENAIDAGATQIEIEVRDGGKEYIRVTDNGVGIAREELPVAFLRHATSKIGSIDELSAVLSLGFRGEALPSIASCSEVDMTSCKAGATAARICIRGGVAEPVTAAAGAPGTTVVVRRLFFNTPARYKFLKQGPAEKRYIAEYVSNMALARPDIAFRLQGDNSLMLSTPGNADLLAAIGAVHGVEVAKRMIPVAWDSPYAQVSGFVAPPTEVRSNRNQETVFVNGRWVQNRLLYAAIEKGYDTMLEPRRYPVAVLHLRIDPTLLDVNVHPAKTEIRLQNESETFKNIMMAVRTALTGANIAPRIAPSAYAAREAGGGGAAGREAVSRDLFAAESAGFVYGEGARTPGFAATSGRAATSGFTTKPGFAAAPDPLRMAGGEAAAAQAELETDLQTESPLTGNSPELLAHMRAPLVKTEIPEDAEAVRTFLQQAPVLGQALNTYLVVAMPWGLWLIDQHVAHERVLYEKVLARKSASVAQLLLTPVTVRLTPAEAAMIEGVRAELEQAGFALEPFGAATFLVRSVPLQSEMAPSADSLRELLVEIAAIRDASGPTRRERMAAMIACKAAVKAGQHLELTAQKALLQALAQTENPFACPHGRPVLIALDKAELERRFGRR